MGTAQRDQALRAQAGHLRALCARLLTLARVPAEAHAGVLEAAFQDAEFKQYSRAFHERAFSVYLND